MRSFSIAIVFGACIALAAVSAQAADFTIMDNTDHPVAKPCNPKSMSCQLDTAITSWMADNTIPAAQLAVRKDGKLILSHAYTLAGQGYPPVLTKNVFRLASISKMLETAYYSQQVSVGHLTGNELVFPYLGITAPLLPSQTPDPRINDITVSELVAHTSGMPGEGDGDPLFEMRDIEVELGSEPLTEQQFAEYLYGVPLLSNPGQDYLYSNVGYFLLQMVLEKASNQEYFSYVTEELLKPLKMTNWSLSPTLHTKVSPNEIAADDPYTGPSVFDISPDAPLEPFNFEGGDIIWELTKGPSDMVTNANSVSDFIHTWCVWCLALPDGRVYDYARDGCIPGASTWAESLNADIDFSILFNSQPCLGFSSTVIEQVRSILGSLDKPIAP